MSSTNGTVAPLVLADIQNEILRGYTLWSIRHSVFAIRDAEGAKRFMQFLLPGSGAPVTVRSAETVPGKPWYGLTLGLTTTGLQALISGDDYNTLAKETSIFGPFGRGAAASAPFVCDIGDSDPKYWWSRSGGWRLPGPPPASDPAAMGKLLHVLLTLHAPNPAAREAYTTLIDEMIAAASGHVPALELAFRQDSDPLAPGHENLIHFGYADGFTQPRVAGVPSKHPLPQGADDPDDRPVVPAYNFVIQPKTPNVPGGAPYRAHPFLYNGSFAAFRVLAQDVGAFEAFIGQAPDKELLAAKMCGRWRNGTPLEVSPDKPIVDPPLHGFQLTNFNYEQPSPHQFQKNGSDDLAQNCPYASHIRRTNPRDDANVKGNVTSSGAPAYGALHRVTRRATAYGPPYDANPDAPRGLVGLFLGTDLTKQFEFVMNDWIFHGNLRKIDYSPNHQNDVDPLFGPADAFGSNVFAYNAAQTTPPSWQYVTVPTPPQTVPLTRFIRTDGGMYVFLPSITAIGLLAQGVIAKPTA